VATQTTLASIASTSLLSPRVGLLIAQYKTNADNGQFTFFLVDFKMALN
jgi:hypothetical protein